MASDSVSDNLQRKLNVWANQIVRRHLKPGEELLWAERGTAAKKDAKRLIESIWTQSLSRVVSGIFAVAFILAYCLDGTDGLIKVLGGLACVVFTFGIDYVFLMTPWGYLLERDRFYGITRERIIIVYASTSLTCTSLYSADICDPQVVVYPDGRGDITVGRKQTTPLNGRKKPIEIKLIGVLDTDHTVNVIRETFDLANTQERQFL